MTNDVDERPQFVEWVEKYSVRRMRWGDFEYDEEGIAKTRGSSQKRVRRVSGEWPPDEHLITLCDGDAPARKSHFGGVVHALNDDTKVVTVYID